MGIRGEEGGRDCPTDVGVKGGLPSANQFNWNTPPAIELLLLRERSKDIQYILKNLRLLLKGAVDVQVF